MDKQNTLYGTLCQFFSLVSKSKGINGSEKNNVWSHFVAPDVESEFKEKKRARRDGFRTLLTVHPDEEGTFPDELNLPACLFKLRTIVNTQEADAVEKGIHELDESGQLQRVLPVLKLLFCIKPVKKSSVPTLKSIDPNISYCKNDEIKSSNEEPQCIPYPVINQNTFEVPTLNYHIEESYISNVLLKLDSTQQLDELDVAHRNLFGALENPPKNLNYLGISKSSKLYLGIKSKEVENKLTAIQDEGYESPTSHAKRLEPTIVTPTLYDCWENLDNLCNTSSIRKTWEAKLDGQEYPTKELPYLSQAPLELMEVLCRHFEENLSLVDESLPNRDSYSMDETEFKKHVLNLILGIESKVFVYQENEFHLADYPFVAGLSSYCLSDLVQPLLECGLLVRRLNKAVWYPDYGPVRNALAEQLQDSLQFHQQLAEETMGSQSFLAVVRQIKMLLPSLRLMHQLWYWSGWDSGDGRGVAFLQYLVDLSTTTVDDHERNLLTAYFSGCVGPFLTYLEHWLYRGRCCDPQNEFFIRADNSQLSERDRKYWISGFTFQTISRTESGPFLNSTAEEDAIIGLLNDVYLCGKTVHLLQLCQAKEVEHGEPLLRIGLSLIELNDIKQECATYALKSPAVVDFVQPTKDLGQQARKAREAKLAELIARKRAKDLDRAEQRTARHAVAKAELDEQLELKRLEEKKKQDRDKLLEDDIQRFQDTIAKREADEKRRLILKYTRLLDDQENVTDNPSEDELNANEPQGLDGENNMIIPTEPDHITTETPTAATTLPENSDLIIPNAIAITTLGPSTQPVSSSKEKPIKTRTKKHKILTKDEIKTKVLLEEFGVDPRCTTKKDVMEHSVEIGTTAVPYVLKDWSHPVAVSYPIEFHFEAQPEPTLQQVVQQEKRDWLQEVKPCEEEIRDLSLSFFVQRSLLLPIRTQCQIVNRSLMTLLTGPEHRFMQHLEVLRQFLFLDNGAFSHSLVTNIGRRLGHLTHIHQLINIPSMNFILQSALNTVHADEYYASRLSFYIKEAVGTASNSQLEALECFTLRYRVGWPLNLILTEEVMDDYSQIFSFVLQLRLAAWALEDVYIHLMKDLPRRWHAVHIARHSIYHFVQSLQNYVMSQLLTLAWSEFLTELKKNARSLDDLYDIHSNYIHRAKSRLLLTPKSASLMKIIRDALNLALKFRSLLLSANYNYTPQLQSQINSISAKAREYAKFIRLILEKVNDRSHQTHLNELLVKLNFNNYYS